MHTAATTSQAALTDSPRFNATMANATAPSTATIAHSSLACRVMELSRVACMFSSRPWLFVFSVTSQVRCRFQHLCAGKRGGQAMISQYRQPEDTTCTQRQGCDQSSQRPVVADRPKSGGFAVYV